MKRFLIYPLVAGLLFISACNNSNNKTTQQGQEHHDHSQHGHHDHNTHQQADTQASQQPVQPQPVGYIPDFKFYKVKSGFSYEKSDIPTGKNTVFILFDPSCGHCQLEAQALSQNYDKIKEINLLYVSMNDPALMVNFLPSFGKELDGKPNVEVLYDRSQEFIRKFHIPNIFPANYVYDSDGLLLSYWEGQKNIDEILAAFTK